MFREEHTFLNQMVTFYGRFLELEAQRSLRIVKQIFGYMILYTSSVWYSP